VIPPDLSALKELNMLSEVKYLIKALQGLTSGEMALPPVSPEVIHIQSF